MENLWVQIIDSSEKVFKIIAIVFAGLAAYYKFLRGRVLKPRLEMLLSATIVRVAAQQYIKVNAKLKNTGLSKIDLDLSASGLRVFGVNHFDNRQTVDSVSWERLATVPVSEHHKWIEPGETIQENWLIGIPTAGNASFFKAELRIAGKKTAWYADALAEKDSILLSKGNPMKDDLEPSEDKHGPNTDR